MALRTCLTVDGREVVKSCCWSLDELVGAILDRGLMRRVTADDVILMVDALMTEGSWSHACADDRRLTFTVELL